MALTEITIDFNIHQLLGDDFDSRRTKAYVKTNVESGTLMDTSTGETRLGDQAVTVNSDGTGSFTTWAVGADGNPTSWQTTLVLDYPRTGRRDRKQRSFGPYTLTTSNDGDNITDLEEEQAVPAEYLTAVTATLDVKVTEAGGHATDAATSASAAAASAALAQDISNIDTPDALVATLVEDTDSATGIALSASIEGRGGTVWTTGTAYQIGQVVVNPSGDVVIANVDHTAAASYATDAANWDAAGDVLFALLPSNGKRPVGKDELVMVATDYGLSTANTGAQNKTALDALGVLADFKSASIYIPAGEYDLTSWQLPVPAQRVGLRIYGDGEGRTVLRGTSADPLVILGDGGPTFDAQHISIADLTLDGDGVSTHCIKHNHTRFCRVTNVEIKGATTYGVWFVGDLANYFALYEHCRFYNSPVHVYLDGGSAGIGGNSNTFRDCHFSSATGTYNGITGGVHVAINGGDTNRFIDCEFITSGTTGIYLHNSAVNNRVRDCQFDGPAVQVNVASVGVSSTVIMGNSGGGTFLDSGSATLFMGASTADSIGQLLYSAGGLLIGGPRNPVGTVPMRVRAPASLATDAFRVEKSDATHLFRVDQSGNIETGPIGVVTAHGHSTFNNAADSSVSVTIDTGPTSAIANIGLRVRSRNAGQTADLQQWQNNAGTRLAAIGPKGEVKLATFTTAGRPTASTSGAGASIFDTTLGKPIWSNGTNWVDATGTTV